MSKIDFRKEIKKRMEKQKINTPEMARRAELNVQTMYNYLAGKSEMTAGNVEKIIMILGFKRLS